MCTHSVCVLTPPPCQVSIPGGRSPWLAKSFVLAKDRGDGGGGGNRIIRIDQVQRQCSCCAGVHIYRHLLCKIRKLFLLVFLTVLILLRSDFCATWNKKKKRNGYRRKCESDGGRNGKKIHLDLTKSELKRESSLFSRVLFNFAWKVFDIGQTIT